MPSKQETVMVIEDDPSVHDFACRVLELEGYHVLGAENGEEGMRLARDSKVDLILLDLTLPGRDGWSVLEEIKGDPGLSATSVIVFSAAVAETQHEKAFSMGAADYLCKPIGVAGLREAVARALHKQR